MKKRIIAFLAAAAMMMSLAACGKQDTAADDNAAATTAATEPRVAPELAIADNAVDFVKNMKLGWNLGNTLDALGDGSLKDENSWGQPTTTQELIDFIKESGFTTIRIPVSWSKHVDADYNIDSAWMDRVQEVVDYAYYDGLYVIINSHHDCDMYYPTEDKAEQGAKYLEKVWSQISERFKDYDERLIFESMNEPRLMNTSKEWWFSSTDPEGVASIECIVKLNQVVVDTVRKSGGYNETRYIMVPSNAANADNALNNAFTVPTDPANRIIVSVHAYSPYDFAMNAAGYKDWDGSHENELGFMDKLANKFIDNGVGVVIGEFGATNKDNLEARVAWAESFTKKASELGISCILWDNGGIKVGSENFGMVNRIAKGIYFPELLEAYLKYYK